jgi:hypothetical protein
LRTYACCESSTKTQIIAVIERQLAGQAHQETRNRKRLRPNQLGVGDFRVFYDMDQDKQAQTVPLDEVKRQLGLTE